MSKDGINILAISGSLRKDSYNTAALHAAKKLAPSGVNIDIFDIVNIPLYNEDVKEKGFPQSVADFCNSIKKSDAILIATPEYNYSIPGVLKNAIDWASRSTEQPFKSKPLAIMGASMGILGTARAQYHLRQCFVYLNTHTMNQPEMMIGAAHTKFDKDGNLTDSKTEEFLMTYLEEFTKWINKLSSK